MTAPRDISRPRPGLYRMRLVKGGPYVAARIIHAAARDPETGEQLDRSPLWSAEIAGTLVADPAPCPVAAGVMRIWESGRHIDLAEWRYLTALQQHAERYEPTLPAANPRQPIDHLKTPTPF